MVPAASLAQGGALSADALRPATVGVQQLEDLVGMLEDPIAREQFLKDLKVVIAAQKAVEPDSEEESRDLPPPETLGARAIFAISAGIRTLSENIMDGVSIVQDLPVAGQWIQEQLSRRELRNFWLGLVSMLFLVVIGGHAAAWAIQQLLLRPCDRLEAIQPPHLVGRLLLASVRAALDLLPIGAFAVAAYLLLPLAGSGDRARFVVLAVVNSHILVAVILAAVNFLLMPSAPNLRLPRMIEKTAVYLYIWARWLAVIVVYGYFVAEVTMLLGAAPTVKALIFKLIGLLTVAMLIVLAIQNRKTVSVWLRGRTAADEAASGLNAFGVFRHRMSDVWHVLVALYLVAFYVVWVLDIGFTFLLRATTLTIVVLWVARLLIVSSAKLVMRIFLVGYDLSLRYPGLEARANRHLPTLGRVIHSFVYMAAALLILQAWGVESLAWLTSSSGVRFIGTGLGILVLLVLALILWEMISLALERYGARLD